MDDIEKWFKENGVAPWLGMVALFLVGAVIWGAATSGGGGSRTTHLASACGSCGQSVGMSSRAGQSCPHCGVFWAGEEETLDSPLPRLDISVQAPQGGVVSIDELGAERFGDALFVPATELERFRVDVRRADQDGAVLVLGSRSMEVRIADATYTVNTEDSVAEFALPVAPRWIDDTLFLPLRSTLEALGLCVVWDGDRVVATRPESG